MTQREITDSENTTWTCVQAYAGLSGESADKATELAQTPEGKVTVVCTPSGGAQTVRLELPANWLENYSDEDLQKAVEANRK